MTLAAGRSARTAPGLGDGGSLSPRSRRRCLAANGLPSLPSEPDVRSIATPPIGTCLRAMATGEGDGDGGRESSGASAGAAAGSGVECALEVRDEASESESNSNACKGGAAGRRRGVKADEHRGVDTYRRMPVEGARRRVAPSGECECGSR